MIQLAWLAQLASSNTVCPENQICSPYHPQYVHAFFMLVFLAEDKFMYFIRQQYFLADANSCIRLGNFNDFFTSKAFTLSCCYVVSESERQ